MLQPYGCHLKIFLSRPGQSRGGWETRPGCTRQRLTLWPPHIWNVFLGLLHGAFKLNVGRWGFKLLRRRPACRSAEPPQQHTSFFESPGFPFQSQEDFIGWLRRCACVSCDMWTILNEGATASHACQASSIACASACATRPLPPC